MAIGSKPDFNVFVTRPYKDGKEDKKFYTKVGAAWKVAESGISIQLDALPVDGKLVLFVPKDE
jgi:hypothetical protein